MKNFKSWHQVEYAQMKISNLASVAEVLLKRLSETPLTTATQPMEHKHNVSLAQVLCDIAKEADMLLDNAVDAAYEENFEVTRHE